MGSVHWQYDNVNKSEESISHTAAQLALGSAPAVADYYVDAPGALASLNAVSLRSVSVPFTRASEAGMQRVSLGAHLNGADGNTCVEWVYAVRPTFFGGVPGVRLERIAVITWVRGPTAVPAAQGGVSGFAECKSVAVASDSLLEGATGAGPAAVNRSPATVEIPDVGEACALIRVFHTGTGATVAIPISRRWK